MSYTRYTDKDSVVSYETTVKGMWSGNTNSLTTFFTSSNQTTATRYYYLDTYESNPLSTTASLHFDLQYGHVSGSGSTNINSSVPHYTPTRVVYGQYRNLIYETEESGILDSTGTPLQDIYVINIARSKYKESIKPGSLSLILSGSSGKRILTDNSLTLSTTKFIGSNRYFDIVSGSLGVVSGSSTYGYMFPDLGIIMLNPDSLTGYITAPSRSVAGTDAQDNVKLFNSIKLGAQFKLQSQETIASRYFFTRVMNGDYNYTTNPSIIDSNGNLLYSDLIDNPQTFITTVGLYNDNNECLAVAKLSKPLVKDFTKESLIRVKLDY